MSPLSAESVESAAPLLLLDHRGASLEALRARLQDRGWRVRIARSPEQSATLLAEGAASLALIAPLTLQADTAEWEALLPHLSPRAGLPWLLLPWDEARPSRFAELVRDPQTLADWLPHPFAPDEAEARISNLMRLQRLHLRHAAETTRLRDQLLEDHKTGLANDRHFRRRLDEEFARCQRHGAPLSLLLLDLDDFKAINDSSTYDFGDEVLRAIAGVIRQSIRNIDVPARIGGDEFAVLMPNTNLEEGVGVGARILTSADGLLVQEDPFHTEVALSVGCASFEGRGLADGSQLFLRANEALKAAKAAGKHRVCFFDPLRRAPSSARPAVPDQGAPSEGQ